MAKADCSTVFEQPAAEVWKIIRDFNNYSISVRGEGFCEIEDGKSGDTIDAVRSVHFRGVHIRQRLGPLGCLAVADLRILRRTGAAGHRLSIDHSRHADRGRRAGVRGVVGDV